MDDLNLTEHTFDAEIIGATEPVMVDFWAPWCGPCLQMAPVVEQMAVELADRARVFKVNVDHNPSLAMRYGIRSIPTFLFFRDGQVVGQQVGGAARERLEAQLFAEAKVA